MKSIAYSLAERQAIAKLRENLAILPRSWALVAVNNNKIPIGNNWQNTPLSSEDFEGAFQSGTFLKLVVSKKETKEIFHPPTKWVKAIGVLCGEPSGGLLFLDHDGTSCDRKIEELSGLSLVEALPETVSVTSGRPGRYQLIYQVPKQYWTAIATCKISTGAFDIHDNAEQLEFRWTGCQSVVAGVHPLTGSYKWINSPDKFSVAIAPLWLIEQMLRKEYKHQLEQKQDISEIDWARSYLKAIPPAEDYNTWIQVGQALHSVSNMLLADWEEWSAGAKNYKPGECKFKWETFGNRAGISIATLGFLAKSNGWQNPSISLTTSPKNKLSILQQKTDLNTDQKANEILSEEVTDLLAINKSAPIQGLLPSKIEAALRARATQLNQPISSFITVGLPVWGSLLNPETRLQLDPEYLVPPILFSGLVGESSTLKTPIFDTLLKPLITIEINKSAELEEAYRQALIDWKADCSEDKPPEPKPQTRYYLLQDITIEALTSTLQSQPNSGIVIAVDELAQFLNSLDQYHKGKGSDRQKWLSLYQGSYLSVKRKTQKDIRLPRTLVGLSGTIQPSILRDQLKDTDRQEDGFWQRFFLVPHPLTRIPPPNTGTQLNTKSTLLELYQQLEKLPKEIYTLSLPAQKKWTEFHNWIEDRVFQNPHSATQSLWRKARDRAARIALISLTLHQAQGELSVLEVPLEIINSAIEFSIWTVEQTILLYAELGVFGAIVEDQDTSRLIALIKKFGFDREISKRDISRTFNNFNSNDAEALMHRAVSINLARTNGEKGKKLKIKFLQI